MSQQLTPPDFILIPRQLLLDDSLQPKDREIFGYIYWLAKLKNEKCTAGNKALAALANTTSTSVRNSLTRLERSGYVAKIYADEAKKIRLEIVCLLSFGINVASASANVALNNATDQQGYVALASAQKKNKKEKLSSSRTTAATQVFAVIAQTLGTKVRAEDNGYIVEVIAMMLRHHTEDEIVLAAKQITFSAATGDTWLHDRKPSERLNYLFATAQSRGKPHASRIADSIKRVSDWIAKAEERQSETGQTIHVMTDEEEAAAERRRAEQTEVLRQRHERLVALNAARGLA